MAPPPTFSSSSRPRSRDSSSFLPSSSHPHASEHVAAARLSASAARKRRSRAPPSAPSAPTFVSTVDLVRNPPSYRLHRGPKPLRQQPPHHPMRSDDRHGQGHATPSVMMGTGRRLMCAKVSPQHLMRSDDRQGQGHVTPCEMMGTGRRPMCTKVWRRRTLIFPPHIPRYRLL